MELTKIQAKVECSTGFMWVHFCYVPTDIKLEFDLTANKNGSTSNYWIQRWMEEDFGYKALGKLYDVDKLKGLIRELYRVRYPEIYTESKTDNQGWIRLWYKNHMEEAIKCYKEVHANDEQS